VIPFDYAHDLRATVSTGSFSVEFPTTQFVKGVVYSPTNWDGWKTKVMDSFKIMANFFLCPKLLASPWGTTWQFAGDGLEWSEVAGTWEIIDNAVVSSSERGTGRYEPLADDSGGGEVTGQPDSNSSASVGGVQVATTLNNNTTPVLTTGARITVPLADDGDEEPVEIEY